jgi:hypothetical protein
MKAGDALVAGRGPTLVCAKLAAVTRRDVIEPMRSS